MNGSAAVATGPASTWFQRYLLPGFAFKALVIGGGYTTGRELAEFFMPCGVRAGLCGMMVATAIGPSFGSYSAAPGRHSRSPTSL
jgi:uncharacterized membrane protein YkvI